MVLVSLLLLPTAVPQEQPPEPERVDVVVTLDVATVTWVPPAAASEYVAGAYFRVYGYEEDGTPHLLETADGLAVAALVEGGFSTYAVAFVVGDVESIRVKMTFCVDVSLEPPYLSDNC